MNRRRVGIALAIVAVVAVALLLLWWRAGGGGGGGAADGDQAARAGALAGRRDARSRRIDVRTVARGSIAGTVRDPGGAPIAGAAVCALGWSRDLPDDATRDPFCATSGADGRYRLADLLPARYQVHAQAPRFVPGRHGAARDDGFALAAGEDRTGVDVVLRPGGVEVHGLVKDIGGGAVAGAWVFVRPGERWSERGGFAVTRSEADGAFTVWSAPGPLHATAQADGYAEGDKEGIAPGQTVEILLTPESVLAGRVVEKAGGAPVPGARVAVGGWDPDEGGNWASATTDDDGRFRLVRLAPGRYKPSATAPGRYGQAAESVLLGVGETVEDVLIEVHPASRVTGRVVLGDGKTPCARGWVALEDRRSSEREHHGLEPDGTVEIDAVLPATYKVEVDCADHLAAADYPDLVVSAGVDPPEQLWKVSDGARLRGVVLGHDGRPLADARVSVQPVASQRGWSDWESEETGADGRFLVEGLRAGRYKVSVTADGEPGTEDPTEVEVAEGGEASVEIRLVRGGTLVGAVVDESGQPVARVSVRASGGKRWSWGGNDHSETRDDGSFEIAGLRPGSYRVTASRERWWGGELRAPGKGDDDQQGEKVEVRAGETARVRLVVERQAGVIRGRVVGAGGAPVTDAFIDAQRESESAAAAEGSARRAMRWGWARTPTLSNPDGSFAVDKLSPGRYTLRAYRKGGGETVAEHVAVGQNVTLTIRQTGSISGRVALDQGGAPERMMVAVSDARTGVRRREEFFRTGGAFTLRDLPAGSFDITVSAPEGTGTASAQLAEGQAASGLAITLGARATVTGRVITGDEGKPLAGYMVNVMPAGKMDQNMMLMNGTMPPTSAADGSFTVPNAPAGRVQIMVFPTDMRGSMYAFARRVATVEGGRSNDVGDIKVQKMRARPDEKAGDFGFQLKQPGPDADLDNLRLEVAVVRPDGPAARAGLKVGDVIVSVDGQDVRHDATQYWLLTHVPPGTAVTFGLERGASLALTAGPPRE